jgi:DNA-binding transcriptional regulator YiaG
MNPSPAEIREARIAAGLTHQRFADLLNVHISTSLKWHAGERKMHPAVWHLVCLLCKPKG